MTEPSAPRPVAGPGRPVPGPAGRPVAPHPGQDRFGDLDGRPVAEHVEVFEDEHARLRRRLGAIDPI